MTNTNSVIVRTLENVWAKIRKAHPDVPQAVIVVASGSDRRGNLKYGHYGAARWAVRPSKNAKTREKVSEILVSGEGLRRSGVQVMTTLLHEAAHGLAHTRKIKDTSRGGRYHNRRFAAMAYELGLEVTKDKAIGWSPSVMTRQAVEKWETEIAMIRNAVRMAYRAYEPNGGNTKSPSRLLKATCGCGTVIRMSQKAYDSSPIYCLGCEQNFRLEG